VYVCACVCLCGSVHARVYVCHYTGEASVLQCRLPAACPGGMGADNCASGYTGKCECECTHVRVLSVRRKTRIHTHYTPHFIHRAETACAQCAAEHYRFNQVFCRPCAGDDADEALIASTFVCVCECVSRCECMTRAFIYFHMCALCTYTAVFAVASGFILSIAFTLAFASGRTGTCAYDHMRVTQRTYIHVHMFTCIHTYTHSAPLQQSDSGRTSRRSGRSRSCGGLGEPSTCLCIARSSVCR
jgi:hypothetical protein